MSQTTFTVAEVVRSLGGNPRSDESANLELLANEIVILREKLRQSEQAEGRAERRYGNEHDSRVRAEGRAQLAESALSRIDGILGEAKRKGLAAGTPLERIKDERRVVEAGHSIR